MNKIIALTLLLLSSSVFANTTIFGMELGVMSEKNLKSKYNVRHTGTNKYTNGNMYSIPVSSIKFSDLKEVIVIFSANGKLEAVLTTFPKNKFNYLNSSIGKKYKLISQRIPFVGNKKVTYRDGSIEITLEAPHMNFNMSMNYISDNFTQAFNRKSRAETREKQESESSQL
ncbi:hypothetical protein PCNPT3_06235 [Psychromonas sp. CNPT3]|uniref:hypothetical protein n=1 Tax=Psychromonas sp. CNPT3 TaxID=314282 RepID=UPI00006E9CFD|nr:hypothetical protein [Psychromonas sp. CNPT3]AGH81187.1 hypothetical protein PCNPT3_06235 [Psychromonas sp. CNPT3]